MASFKSSRVLGRHIEQLSSQLPRAHSTVRQLPRNQTLSTRTVAPAGSSLSPSSRSCRSQQRRQQQLPQPRSFSFCPSPRKETTNFDDKRSASSSGPQGSDIPPPRSYTLVEVQDLSSTPSPNRILIDVREPSELLATGRIPSAKSMPIGSSPDAVFMSPEDFEDKFGFARPGPDDEVIFYCKAGVRSRQAALLAGQARPMFGGKVGNFEGSWLEWEKSGGKVEKE